jgi:hypothetical protein
MTTFINRQTLIDADWLNGIDSKVNTSRRINVLETPYAVPTNGTSDALLSLQLVFDLANETDHVIIDGQGLWYCLSDTLKIRKKNVTIENFKFKPHSSYVETSVDYTNMGTGFAGTTGTMITNRGKPLVRATYRDSAWGIDDFKRIFILNVEIDGQDKAPGIFIEGCSDSVVEDYWLYRCKGYHLAALVKNVNTWIGKGKIKEADFGSAKQLDPITNPYVSAGFVQTCPDIVVYGMSTSFCKDPIWADGFSNTRWTNLHPFNGNGVAAGLRNIYVGPNCSGICCQGMYNGRGFVELRSFNHSFTGGRFVATPEFTNNRTYAKLVSPGANASVAGLVISDIVVGEVDVKTVELDETAGNFTEVRGCKIESLATERTAGASNDSFAHNKVITQTIASGDWVNEGSIFRYDWDIEGSILFKNVFTSITSLTMRDRRSGTNSAAWTWYYRFAPNSGPGTKVIQLYSNIAINCTAIARIDEGDPSTLIS